MGMRITTEIERRGENRGLIRLPFALRRPTRQEVVAAIGGALLVAMPLGGYAASLHSSIKALIEQNDTLEYGLSLATGIFCDTVNNYRRQVKMPSLSPTDCSRLYNNRVAARRGPIGRR